jgi:DNA-binding MarR family transcriptional regulator
MPFDPLPDPDAQRAWDAFLTMQRKLFIHLHRHLQSEFDMSGPDYEILLTLSASPEGRMRPFELSQATQWEKSRLSHQLKRMAERGLVSREPTRDPRYSDIVLTEKGRELITRAAPRHAAAVHAIFVEALGSDRLVPFAEACEDVSASVSAHKVGDYGATDPSTRPPTR